MKRTPRSRGLKASVSARSGQRARRSRLASRVPGGAAPHDDAPASQIDQETPPVVAMGASAGGLEALREFFTHMPPDSGLAFVMAMHLDPSHKSAMVELISRVTPMVVVEASDGMPVQANHLYMIPPAMVLTLRGGRLRTFGGTSRRERTIHPVDALFTSVAEDQGVRAAAVVLSGMGSDGTVGVHAIKRRGGYVVVQSPDSAKASSMPESAIAGDDPDAVLPPRAMPAALMAHFADLGSAALTDRSPKDEIASVERVLRARTGHDFSHYKRGTIERRIRRRMELRRIRSHAQYASVIREDAAEALALFRDLLVGVTEFFREPESWEALRELVIDPLLAMKTDGGIIRVWVPGCATGQEAYSIGMLLSERMQALDRQREVKIFATDINDVALDLAREGVFTEEAVSRVPRERRDRFFVRSEPGMYQIARDIRGMVVFAQQSLIADPPFSRLDLISCRNVLIYLDQEVQRKVLNLFFHALRQDGYLFLGNSESTQYLDEKVRPLSKKWRIYQRLGAPGRPVSTFPVTRPATGLAEPVRVPAVPAATTFLRQATPQRLAAIVQRLVLDKYSPASVLVNEQNHVLYFCGPTGEYLHQPTGTPTSDLLELVRPGIKARLRVAIEQVQRTGKAMAIQGIRMRRGRSERRLAIRVNPIRESTQAPPLYLVVFEEESLKKQRAVRDKEYRALPDETLVRQLEYDLRVTREDLQAHMEGTETANEELKAANEEMMSMNEELQSSNEELETSKEELQSLNEELTTVNNQLQNKVEELETTNNDLENFLTSTDLATIFLDREFRIRRFTPAIRKLVSLVSSDVGRPITDFAHRVSDEGLLRDASRVLDDLQPVHAEVTSPDGRTYLRRILPYRTETDQIDGVVVTFTDITERKAAMAEQARLAAIVQSSDDAIYSKDLDGIIMTWNAAAERMFGYTAAEAVGRPVTMLVPEDRRAEEDVILQRIREGKRVSHGETSRLRSTGELVDVSLSISPIRDTAGKVIGASAIARDIHERKAAEAQQRLLLAELDHRVKNTLAIVVSLASQTIETCTSLAQFGEVFEGRVMALARAHKLLSECRWRGASLRDLLTHTLAPYGEPGGRPAFDLDGEDVLMPSKVAVDFAMIFHELATNAVKYGPLGSGSRGSLKVSWTIREEGEDRALWLEWLERGEESGNIKSPTSGDGTSGLGLTLIRSCVENDLRGRFEVNFLPNGARCFITARWTSETVSDPRGD